MTTIDRDRSSEVLARRPKRADALRNYEKLIAAAREAFAEGGAVDLARGDRAARRRRDRHALPQLPDPPGRCSRRSTSRRSRRSAARPTTSPSCRRGTRWSAWLHRFVGYLATKRALAEELLAYLDRDADVLPRLPRPRSTTAGEPLLRARAGSAGVVRADTTFDEVIQMVGGIAKIPTAGPEQIDRILEVALDGLRSRP